MFHSKHEICGVCTRGYCSSRRKDHLEKWAGRGGGVDVLWKRKDDQWEPEKMFAGFFFLTWGLGRTHRGHWTGVRVRVQCIECVV